MKHWVLIVLSVSAFLFAANLILALKGPAGFRTLSRRKRLASLVEASAPCLTPGRRAFWAGFLYLAGVLAFLEIREPFYFNQDDNFAQFLPGILHGCRSFFEGVFPTLNPYQMNGIPLAGLGTYALTYPVTCLAWLFSKHILANEYWTLDVFVIFHFLSGYGASYALCRREGLRPGIAVTASLAFVLSGYSLIAGRSWYYMTPGLLWTPLLMMSFLKFARRETGPKWVWGTGLAFGIYFHAGNVQMWAYTGLFYFLGVLILMAAGKGNRRGLLDLVSASLVAAALALPLLWPMYQTTRHLVRELVPVGGIPVPRGLLAMIAPYPLMKAPHPYGWGSTDNEFMTQLYYSGTLFSLAALAGTLLVLMAFFTAAKDPASRKKLILENIWLILGIPALALALGEHGFLWGALLKAPFFDKFKHPFKFLHFVNLFWALGGGLVLERFFSLAVKRTRTRWALYALFLGLLSYHAVLCRTSFYSYGNRTYPELPAAMTGLLKAKDNPYPVRIYASAPARSRDPDFVLSLQHNFPSVYGILALGGYEPLAYLPDVRGAALYEYGVKYILKMKYGNRPGTFYPKIDFLEQKEIMRFKHVRLIELNPAIPLAFAAGHPETALPVRFTGSGAVVDTSSLDGRADVVVNMTFRKMMRARSGSEGLQIGRDEWRRVIIRDCPPAREVEVVYTGYFPEGLRAGAGAGLIAVLFQALLVFIRRKNPLLPGGNP